MEVKIQICKNCGREFCRSKEHIAYCSDECRKEFKRKQNRKYTYDKVCAVCGKAFQAKFADQQCCSKSCGSVLHSGDAFLKREGFTDVTAQIVTRLLVIDGIDLAEAAKIVGWDEAALEKAMLENRQLVDPWRAYFEKERELRARMRRRYHVRVLP